MSPVEIALLGACVLLLAVAVGAVVTMRHLTGRAVSLERAVDRLREQVEELSRREAAREVAEAARAEAADWVIAFDGDEGSHAPHGRHPHTASTQQVVSTTLGEPMIKVAAFSHGVRRALREEKRAHLAFQVRREYRRRRRATRSRERAAQASARRGAAQ
ncbi:MAG TPA: hypothetical protein VHG70_08150 [Nocardioidaceae bacterium]|nr:hypothetical protein [Nocardioidaceae bacterium]